MHVKGAKSIICYLYYMCSKNIVWSYAESNSYRLLF